VHIYRKQLVVDLSISICIYGRVDMSNTTLQAYIVRLRRDVASITSSPATPALLALVSKRTDNLTMDYFDNERSYT
jgi:hypothetical protein